MAFPRRMMGIHDVEDRVSDVEDGYPCRGGWPSPRQMMGIPVVEDALLSTNDGYPCRGGCPSLDK